MATTRRRSQLLADSDNDVSPAGQGAERVADNPDKMVMVSIANDFTLIGDDHKPVDYKAGVDEMPLSHAKHWWAINRGGVKLYAGRRKSADDAPPETVFPPTGDPDKMPELSAAVRLGVDNTKL